MAEYNMQNRRDFLRYLLGAAAIYGGASSAKAHELLTDKGVSKLTILYTNDVHSRVEPFPDNDPKYPNQGGAARRAAIIKRIRSEDQTYCCWMREIYFRAHPILIFMQGSLNIN